MATEINAKFFMVISEQNLWSRADSVVSDEIQEVLNIIEHDFMSKW